MSRVIQDATACREALARLPELNLGELRQQWRILYKTEASPHLSRELLVRASHTGCRKSLLAGCARGNSASSNKLQSSSKKPEQRPCLVAPS